MFPDNERMIYCIVHWKVKLLCSTVACQRPPLLIHTLLLCLTHCDSVVEMSNVASSFNIKWEWSVGHRQPSIFHFHRSQHTLTTHTHSLADPRSQDPPMAANWVILLVHCKRDWAWIGLLRWRAEYQTLITGLQWGDGIPGMDWKRHAYWRDVCVNVKKRSTLHRFEIEPKSWIGDFLVPDLPEMCVFFVRIKSNKIFIQLFC